MYIDIYIYIYMYKIYIFICIIYHANLAWGETELYCLVFLGSVSCVSKAHLLLNNNHLLQISTSNSVFFIEHLKYGHNIYMAWLKYICFKTSIMVEVPLMWLVRNSISYGINHSFLGLIMVHSKYTHSQYFRGRTFSQRIIFESLHELRQLADLNRLDCPLNFNL